MSTPARIKRLEQDVVNRIAAGEIIIGPSNALKELLENAIDAGSTRIEVVCKEGGLKLLQITDNGSGISKEDLAILCERHTTSKLTDLHDLDSIATYGFRGEALASISHISHLTVTTKTSDSSCAFRAKYVDGKMLDGSPKAIAGNTGTQLTVEDLFFNYEARLRAFKNGNEEYQKILDVAGKYAIHSSGISISCKRHGDSHPALSVQKQWDTVDRIRSFYGSSIANELMQVDIAKNDTLGVVKGVCQVTNANYSSKKTMPYIMFINHRLVTCQPLQRALSQVYSMFLPKGGHPFVYLSLEIVPSNVDVNIHPTKREVRFLNEEEIVDYVCTTVQEALGQVDSSRAFKTQTVLPGFSSAATPSKVSAAATPAKSSPYAYHQVRTDYSQPTITTLMNSQMARMKSTPSKNTSKRDFEPVRLASVASFRKQVVDDVHRSLTQIVAEHSFIGVVDYSRRLAAVQHNVKLYLIDYGALGRELFYQIALAEFGNFGTVELEEPIPMLELLQLGTEEEGEAEVILELFKLEDKRAMLEEYFSIMFDDRGEELLLKTLPMLLAGYTPPPASLPGFFIAISKADWNEEDDCLKTILNEIANLYTPESLPDEDAEYEDERSDLASKLEHVIFPAAKKRLTAPKLLSSSVVEVASLPGLYKVFERC